jgi:hypothetical protein
VQKNCKDKEEQSILTESAQAFQIRVHFSQFLRNEYHCGDESRESRTESGRPQDRKRRFNRNEQEPNRFRNILGSKKGKETWGAKGEERFYQSGQPVASSILEQMC